MGLIKNQTFIDLFDTTLTKDYSTLLFEETASFDNPKGIGVWAKPESKGQFIYIAGRPYQFNQTDLRNNIEFILHDLLNEVVGVVIIKLMNYPIPFN